MTSSNGCPLLRGIHWSPVDSPHKAQWRGSLMYSLFRTHPSKRLSKQSRHQSFGTPSRSLWRHSNVQVHDVWESSRHTIQTSWHICKDRNEYCCVYNEVTSRLPPRKLILFPFCIDYFAWLNYIWYENEVALYCQSTLSAYDTWGAIGNAMTVRSTDFISSYSTPWRTQVQIETKDKGMKVVRRNFHLFFILISCKKW